MLPHTLKHRVKWCSSNGVMEGGRSLGKIGISWSGVGFKEKLSYFDHTRQSDRFFQFHTGVLR